MKKSKDLLGLPLIRIADAKELGTIGGFVINPQQKSVDFLLLEKVEGEDLKGIPFGMIEGMGDFAVTVADDNHLINIMKVGLIRDLLEKKVELVGSKLISRKGMYLGEITECAIHEENGQILVLFFIDRAGEEASIQAEDILTIGERVVIMKDALVEEESPWREVTKEEKEDVIKALYEEEVVDEEEEQEELEEEEVIEEEVEEQVKERVEAFGDTRREAQEVFDLEESKAPKEEVTREEVTREAEKGAKEEKPSMETEQPEVSSLETTTKIDRPSDPALSIIERKRKELVGKRLMKDIKTEDGQMVARADTVITDAIYDKVQGLGYEVFIELATSVKD